MLAICDSGKTLYKHEHNNIDKRPKWLMAQIKYLIESAVKQKICFK
jgi:hypothetical protein